MPALVKYKSNEHQKWSIGENNFTYNKNALLAAQKKNKELFMEQDCPNYMKWWILIWKKNTFNSIDF